MNIRSLISASLAVVLCSFAVVSCSPADKREVDVEVKEEVAREVTLTVPSVTCAACLASIRKEVINEPGVVSMGGDASTKKVVLRLSASAPEDDTHLVEAIKRAGFDATID